MDSMPISKFKATCLAVLERVHRTGKPLLVTKRGKPIAQVVPPPPPEPTRSGFGAMKGSIKEIGDVVSPLGEDDWEATR